MILESGNPLRKKELESSGVIPYTDPRFAENWKNVIKYSSIQDLEALGDQYKDIKIKYERLKQILPPRAEEFLDNEFGDFLSRIKRPTTKKYKKIFEYLGVQVFVDTENLPEFDYSEKSLNYKKIKNSVVFMVNYIRDILPNRKPKIVITKSPKLKPNSSDEEFSGLEVSKLIFIDSNYINSPAVFIHEYAHFVADLIPSQSMELLKRAYQEVLDIYARSGKRKKIDADDVREIDRKKISKKLGFPEYGLKDYHEFFAVLIENWKSLPNNKATYKFKSLVKNVITRL